MREPVVVESHHHVLSAWAEYRAGLKSAPRLITFDHHTDTSKPFRSRKADEEQRLRWISEIDFRNPATVNAAIAKLDHDEHIVTAIQAGILSSAFVVAQKAQDTGLTVYKEHRIMCRSVERPSGSRPVSREDCDRVLETDFLDEVVASFNEALKEAGEPPLDEEPYILDIDLDYFNTRRSIVPKDPRTFQKLSRAAGLITIATEPGHVSHCALDEGLTSEMLLVAVVDLLS